MRLDENLAPGSSPRLRARSRPRSSFAVVSTFPPTPCGIATFSAALCAGLEAQGAEVDRIELGDPQPTGGASVTGHVDAMGCPSPSAAAALGRADVVIVQHEYGLYAGRDGVSVLALLGSLSRPAIVVAHTVLASPTVGQRAVLHAVAEAADAVVVMTENGAVGLRSGFSVDAGKVSVIAHGAAVAPDGPAAGSGTRRGVLTWGLLGPGKGIEWAIDALASLQDLRPPVDYCIAGATHPKVVDAEGEAYREMLGRRAVAAGVTGHVRFDAGYRSVAALSDLIRGAEVVVLPYDSPDQVTSGVLVDAVAAGRPVVSTAFPHAVELLAGGAGLVVPRRDPVALAAALRRVLVEPGLAEQMATEARRIAPGLAWPAVARRYTRLGDHLLAQRSAVGA